MSDITIITVNWFSAGLIEALLANMSQKARNPDCLRMMVIDNTNSEDELLRQIETSQIQVEIHPLDSAGLVGSRGHAFALNHAIDKLTTEFAVIVDPDIHIFAQSWDSLCIGALGKHDAVAIGAPYPFWKIGRYHDFPSPPFCFFRTEVIKDMQSDWTPYSSSTLGRCWIFAVRQLGRLGGFINRRRYEQSPLLRRYAAFAETHLGTFSRDSGWRIAAEARRKGLKSILFENVLPDRMDLAPSDGLEAFGDLAREYELYYYDNKPILTHKYGTAGRPWRTQKGADEKYWRKAIETFEKAL